MTGYLTGSLLAGLLVFQPATAGFAQSAKTEPAKEASKEMRLNGCISPDTARPGQFNFLDDGSGGRYHLTGKMLEKFVRPPVAIVGRPPGEGVTFKTGLWPSPDGAE